MSYKKYVGSETCHIKPEFPQENTKSAQKH